MSKASQKQDIKTLTNMVCSHLYVSKKEKEAWFRIKKFLEESCQPTPGNKQKPEYIDSGNKSERGVMCPVLHNLI